jgi:BMFP domain-containing protein YqiC
MTAPYRDDLAALEARYAALEAEVADRERASNGR